MPGKSYATAARVATGGGSKIRLMRRSRISDTSFDRAIRRAACCALGSKRAFQGLVRPDSGTWLLSGCYRRRLQGIAHERASRL